MKFQLIVTNSTGKGWQCGPEAAAIKGSFIPDALQEPTAPSVESLLICPRVPVRFRSASTAGPLFPPLNANGRQPARKDKVWH